MSDEKNVVDGETVEVVASTEASVKPVRRRLDDTEFFNINEEVATGDNPTIEKIAELTGMTKSSVTQRRGLFNKTYKVLDPPVTLTALPRGTTKLSVTDMHKTIVAAIAAKKEAAAEAELEAEMESDAS